MKRYYREEDGDLYDRKLRTHVPVLSERRIGDHYYINECEDQKVIPIDDVEEVH